MKWGQCDPFFISGRTQTGQRTDCSISYVSIVKDISILLYARSNRADQTIHLSSSGLGIPAVIRVKLIIIGTGQPEFESLWVSLYFLNILSYIQKVFLCNVNWLSLVRFHKIIWIIYIPFSRIYRFFFCVVISKKYIFFTVPE